MKKGNILLFFLFVLSISACKEKPEISQEKPNVLIIFPDQLRRYSAGFWQEEPYREHVVGKADPVVTPTIDQLAQNGVVFTNAISNFPLCSPYRGMMLTGQYPEQNGIWGNCKKGREHGLKDNVKAITDYFFEAGYNTSYFGKCHWEKTEPLFDTNGNFIGTTESPGGHYVNAYDTYVPSGAGRHSIEYFYQALKDEHFDSRIYSNDPKAIEGKSDGEIHRPKVFSAKNEAYHIVNYLKNTHGQRDTEKPFCMIWALNPPHNPWDDANTDMDMMRMYYDTNNFAQLDELVVRENADLDVASYARNYFANVTSVDKYVGEVIEELQKLGELENTIVVFTSDHGEMLGSHGKKGKNLMETESVAIPFIVHYPEQLKPGITTSIFGVTDVLPTVLGLAGLSDKISDKVNGDDFSKELENPNVKVQDKEAELLMLGNERGVFTKEYTFSIRENVKNNQVTEVYLYDNIADTYQHTRLSKEERPEVVSEMLEILGVKLKEANDPWYKLRKYSDLIVYPE
jgi:arylsulfatase A-like enzyme